MRSDPTRRLGAHIRTPGGLRGSLQDRHEHIGEGRIGVEGFAAILRRPEVRALDVVLETPADREQRVRELDLLRSLIA